jgi:hypothetical protein
MDLIGLLKTELRAGRLAAANRDSIDKTRTLQRGNGAVMGKLSGEPTGIYPA